MVALDPSPSVADVVLVVEATANLGAYLDHLKPQYILPTLEYFNGGPPEPTDYGQDNSCTLYNIVYFHAADAAPDPAARCTSTTTSTHKLLTWLDKLPYSGGVGDAYSHITEGLGTALQVFDEIKKLRDKSLKTERHCILICNSPPFQIECQESYSYLGYTAERMAKLMGQQGINLSIISPRKIAALQKLFDESSTENSVSPFKDYSIDPKHMVLLHGFKLTEQSHSLNLEEEKQANERISFILNTSTQNPIAPTRQVSLSSANTMAEILSAPDNPTPFKVPSSVTGAANMPGSAQVTSVSVMGQNPNQGMSLQSQVSHSQPQVSHSQPQVSHSQPQHTVSQAIQGGQIRQSMPPNTQMGIRSMIPDQQVQQMGMAGHRPPMMRTPLQNMNNMGVRVPQPNMMNPVNQPNPAQQTMLQQQQQQQQLQQQQQQQQVQQMNQLHGQVSGNPTSMVQQVGPNFTNPQPIMAQQGNTPPLTGIPTSNMVSMGQNVSLPMAPNQFSNQEPLMAPIQAPNMVRPGIPPQRKTVWTGALEWQDKSKVPTTDPTAKLTRSLACNVTIATTEPDLNTSKWPNKLIMQLIPQTLLNPLSNLFKQSRMVHFNFTPSDRDALKNLLKVLSNGFAGCVHFPPITQCDVRILMLLYHSKKQMFVGMLPKNQLDFVSGIRQVITSSKKKQMMQSAHDQFTQQPMPVQHMPTPPQQLQQGVSSTGAPMAMQTPQGPISATSGLGMPGSVNIQQTTNQLQLDHERQVNMQKLQVIQQYRQEAKMNMDQKQQQQQLMMDDMYFNGPHPNYYQGQRQQFTLQQQQQLRLQMRQQQQQQQQHQQQQQQQQQAPPTQQIANQDQLRHLLMNNQVQQQQQQQQQVGLHQQQQQHQLRQQQLMMQQQQQARVPAPQAPPTMMGAGNQQMMQQPPMQQMPQQTQSLFDDLDLQLGPP